VAPPANLPLYHWLRESGGSRDAAVNGSSTPVVFEWVSTEDHAYISRLVVSYVDTGTFDAALYGNGIILTNGISVEVVENGTVLDLLDGETVKSNADWQAVSYDFHYNDIGQGDNVASIRWTFARAGHPLELNEGDSLRVTIQDDLTGLTSHYFQLQGYQT
jgi:hypothetical protein